MTPSTRAPRWAAPTVALSTVAWVLAVETKSLPIFNIRGELEQPRFLFRDLRLRGSLETLGSAGYGRESELDLLTLNTALEQGTDAVKQLRWRKLMRIN